MRSGAWALSTVSAYGSRASTIAGGARLVSVPCWVGGAGPAAAIGVGSVCGWAAISGAAPLRPTTKPSWVKYW